MSDLITHKVSLVKSPLRQAYRHYSRLCKIERQMVAGPDRWIDLIRQLDFAWERMSFLETTAVRFEKSA